MMQVGLFQKFADNEMKMKSIKLISWFLGIAMFMFGILKIIIPTVVGSAFNISLVTDNNLTKKKIKIIILLASAAIIPMMATATYVHLQPDVPAEVLPLKIKPPFIPIFILLLALANIFLLRKQKEVKAK